MGVSTRKVTLEYELPAELVQALEEMAVRKGRTFEDELIGYVASHAGRPERPSPEEVERRNARFQRHIGAWSSGDPNSSENERIDADLAREYGEGLDSYGSQDAS